MFTTVQQLRVLVTGASRGVGAFLARGLAREGAALTLVARDASRLERVAEDCRALGAQARVLPADVCLARERERLVDEAGELDVLVNNAGVEITKRLVDQTAEEVRAQIETNLVAPLELTRLVLPGMIARGRGVVVGVSSMSGKIATPYNAVYAATKHGLNGLSASLDVELEGTGVHVGVVCPAFIADSGMWADTGLEAPALAREVPQRRVLEGVLRVIRGEGEVLVTAGPTRPLLALREVFPAVERRVLRAMGVTATLAARAARLK